MPSFEPPVSAKQAEVINDTHRYILVSGARESSKSYGVMHSIPFRMWNIRNYVGVLVGTTTSQSIDSGLWTVLTEKVMPDWIEGNIYSPDGKEIVDKRPFGMEWITKPRSQMITHKMFFDISNKFGEKSRFYLDSLDVETDVEKKYKGRIFCDIVLSEAANFLNRGTFDCLKLCLRDFPAEQLRFILDTNPALHDAESHWIYKLFYVFRSLDLNNLSEDGTRELNLDAVPEGSRGVLLQSLKELQDSLAVHEFAVDDNCFISEEKKRSLFAAFAHSKDALDRNYYGRWVRGSGDGIFSEVFQPEICVLGDLPNASKPEPEILLPEDDCFELMGSFDTGRRNTMAYIIEPVTIEIEEHGEMIPRTGFKYLDEYGSLGRQQSTADLAEWLVETLDFWEDIIGKRVRFEAWSDNSAFDLSGQTETSEAQDLWRLTNGRVELRSITAPHVGMKGHGAVERRISFMQRMLFEQRLWLCKSKCPHLLQMFQSIKRNSQGKLSAVSIFKHSFDAASYGPAVRCWMEMRKTSPRLKTDKVQNAKIITTSL